MAIDFSIVPEESLIVTRFTDRVSASDLLEAYKAVFAHPDAKSGFCELVLLHDDVVLELAAGTIAEVVALTKAFHESGDKSSRAAIVMPDHFDHSIAEVFHQFAELTARSHSQVLTCFDVKQAAHWLGVSEDNVAP